MKLLRLLILLQLVRLVVARTRLPRHAVAEPRLGGDRIGPGEIQTALVIGGLYVAVIALSWVPFLVLGYPALDSLFEVASAVGTVGLSAGITRPELEPGLRAVLCADMLLGRLEILAFLVLFAPGTWFGRRPRR